MRPEAFKDHYSQARQFYRSQTVFEQAHLASALVLELSKVEAVHVRQAMVGHLRHIEESLAQRVAAGLGLATLPEPPASAAPVLDLEPSPALGLITRMKDTLAGRTLGLLIADGSDGALFEPLRMAAVKVGARVRLVAPRLEVRLADGTLQAADHQLAGTPSVLFDAVAIVLSAEGAAALAKDSEALAFVRDAVAHLKAIAVDPGGKALLDQANVKPDAGVLGVDDLEAFLTAARTRQWTREQYLRPLA